MHDSWHGCYASVNSSVLGREIQEWSCKHAHWCMDWKAELRDNNSVTAVLTVFEDNRRYTIDDIQEQLKEKHCLNVSRASICRIMKEPGL